LQLETPTAANPSTNTNTITLFVPHQCWRWRAHSDIHILHIQPAYGCNAVFPKL